MSQRYNLRSNRRNLTTDLDKGITSKENSTITQSQQVLAVHNNANTYNLRSSQKFSSEGSVNNFDEQQENCFTDQRS